MSTEQLQLADQIENRRSELAAKVTQRHYELAPELDGRYGPIGRQKCREDAEIHLTYLAQSIRSGAHELFRDYVLWARVMLEARNIPGADLVRNLGVIEEVLGRELTDAPDGSIQAAIRDAVELLRDSVAPESWIESSRPHSALVRSYLDALLAGDRRRARQLILDAMESGAHVREIYLHVFQVAQYEVGRLWQTNQISVGDEHFCTAATQWIMSELYPHIFSNQERKATFVAASVGNEMHEIGVRMVADFLEIEGWDTHYLGARTPPSSIIEAICVRKADVVGLSATISHHVRTVAEIIAAIRADDRCRDTKILVGGYPFMLSPTLWKSVGADAFARDAAEAVEEADRLLQQLRTS